MRSYISLVSERFIFDSFKIFILGGMGDTLTSTRKAYLSLAVKYDGSGWTEVGSLMATRIYHRSIVTDGTIMHIGGYGQKYVSKLKTVFQISLRQFEKWTPNGNSFDKEQFSATLNEYY